MGSEILSIADARKLALHSQQILTAQSSGKAIDATRNAIQHLGYVQIDTISVVQRAHHHTLWNRNPRYKNAHLDLLQENGEIFEYWAHAAAYLPISDFRFYLPNMKEIANGRKRWYECDPKVKRRVFERIGVDGPLQAKDFERKETGKLAMWEWKPAKYALEQLFMEGKIMIARRKGFQKVYDLTSRVLPQGVDTTLPSDSELCRFLIRRFLHAHGPGQTSEIAYLRAGMKGKLQAALDEMEEDGELTRVIINNEHYYIYPGALDFLSKPLSKARMKILSPFDNFVIQRKRIERLFGFDFQIECYVPAVKRKYGYFCLPILWNASLTGRIDCKADRHARTLIIKNLVLEPSVKKIDEFMNALEKQLQEFMVFNNCDEMVVNSVSDKGIKKMLSARFK